MKKNIILISIILILPIITYMFLSNATVTANTINESYGKPQVIKFTSSMCLDCQTMNKIIEEVYPKYKDKITLTEIHVDNRNSFSNKEIQKYNVTLVPTIILIDKNGKQTKRIEGAIDKNLMDKYLKGLE